MSNSEPSRALIAYAALAHRLTAGGDVVQALMSFFHPIADEFSGEFFDADKFCSRVLKLYGLNVPKLAALGWCERLVQERLLEVHSRTGPIVYRWKGHPGGSADENVDGFQAKVDLLLKQFRDKCKEQLSIESYGIVQGKLETEFFDRLLKLDSMRLLLRKDNASVAKSSNKTLSLKPVTPSLDDRVAVQLDYLVAEFILNLRDSSQAEFDLISSILFANMAAEAVSTFREPEQGAALNGMRVYLDTPLILDMFRVNSGFEHYADELWSLLKKSGAQIKVFDHTVQESEAVIAGRLATIRSGTTPFSHSSTAGLRLETLALLDGKVAQNLEARGVVVERDPETSLLKLSQRALGTVQSEMDKKMGGWKRDAKYFDEKTVFSVIAIRSPMRLETVFSKARALLLTRNTPLVSIANAAWRSWLDEATNESKSLIARSAPIAISDKQFAGLVWLIGGADKAAPLSRARMVAHCAAAIRPRADVVTKACSLVLEVHGNEEGEKFAALMVNDRAEQAVMRISSGDPESLTKARLPEIVEKAMLAAGEHAAQLEREKAETEKQALAEEHQKTINAKQGAIKQLETESALSKAQSELELTNARRAATELKMGEMAREIRDMSNKISAFDLAYEAGQRSFRSSRILVALIYGLIFLLIGQALTGYELLSAAVSFALTLMGFWFLPDAMFNPICQRIAVLYFCRSAQLELGRSAERCNPDFVKSIFPERNVWEAEKDHLEDALVKLRASSI